MIKAPPNIVNMLKPLHPFRKMNDTQIAIFAEKLKTTQYLKGDVIYEQGDDTDRLYIVYEGAVELTQYQRDVAEEIGHMEQGDFFGFEVWDSNLPRSAKAVALNDVTLLYLEWDVMHELADEIPQVKTYLKMMHQSYYLSMRVKTDFRSPGENIHFICRKHPLFLWIKLLPPVALAILTLPTLIYLYLFIYIDNIFVFLGVLFLIIAFGVWGTWAYIEWGNDDFVVTNKRVISRERVIMLYDSRQEAPLGAILSVTTSTTYWGRRLIYGDVILRTYTGSMTLSQISEYQQLASILEEKQAGISARTRKEEKEERIKTVRQRLGFSMKGAEETEDDQIPR